MWLVVTGTWLLFSYIFPYIGHVIIPNDELNFFRGVGIPPTSNIYVPVESPRYSKNHSIYNLYDIIYDIIIYIIYDIIYVFQLWICDVCDESQLFFTARKLLSRADCWWRVRARLAPVSLHEARRWGILGGWWLPWAPIWGNIHGDGLTMIVLWCTIILLYRYTGFIMTNCDLICYGANWFTPRWHGHGLFTSILSSKNLGVEARHLSAWLGWCDLWRWDEENACFPSAPGDINEGCFQLRLKYHHSEGFNCFTLPEVFSNVLDRKHSKWPEEKLQNMSLDDTGWYWMAGWFETVLCLEFSPEAARWRIWHPRPGRFFIGAGSHQRQSIHFDNLHLYTAAPGRHVSLLVQDRL